MAKTLELEALDTLVDLEPEPTRQAMEDFFFGRDVRPQGSCAETRVPGLATWLRPWYRLAPLLLLTGCLASSDFASPPGEFEQQVYDTVTYVWELKGVSFGHMGCDSAFANTKIYRVPEEEADRMPEYCDQPDDSELAGCYISGAYDADLIFISDKHATSDGLYAQVFIHEMLHLVGECSGVAHHAHTNPLLWKGAENEYSGPSVQRLSEDLILYSEHLE